MVEAVGNKAITASDLRIAPALRASAPVEPTPAATAPAAGTNSALAGLAKAMAASPPVSVDRVAQIKAAIASGTYPILPETIADRMIALQLDWSPNDKA